MSQPTAPGPLVVPELPEAPTEPLPRITAPNDATVDGGTAAEAWKQARPVRRPGRTARTGREVVHDRRPFNRVAARIGLWQALLLGAVLAGAQLGWLADGFSQVPTYGWLHIVIVLLCLALLAFTTIRRHGRWLDEALLQHVRFRGRVRRARRTPGLPAFDSLVPFLDARGYTDRLGNRIGLLTDRRSWTAIARVEPDLTVAADPARLERLLDTLRSALDDDLRLDAAHLVTWAAPMPTVSLGDGVTTDLSVRQVSWAAVRFVPAAAPGAVEARGGDEAGAMRATSIAILRLSSRIRDLGYSVRVLDANEVLGEVYTSLGLDPVRGAPTPRAVESWWAWSVGALHQAAYRLRSAPRTNAAVAAIIRRETPATALFSCASVLYVRDEPGPVRTQVAVRIGVSAQQNPRAFRAALRNAKLGWRYEPLNGQHAPGVRSTIPLGLRRP